MEGFGGDLGEILQGVSFIASEELKDFLWKVILILGAVDLLLAVTTVVHRIYVDRRDRLYKRAYDRYSDQVVNAVLGEGKIDPSKRDIEKEALGDVCLEILKKFKGSFTERVRQIAQEMGVVDYYLEKTRSLIVHDRVVAYEKLAYLKVYEIKEDLRRQLEKEEREWVMERLIFSYALLSEDFRDVELLFRSLERMRHVSFKFVEFLWFDLLDTFSEKGRLEEFLDFVWENFSERPFILRAFVEALGNKRIPSLGSFVLRVYERYREDTTMRISCVRALGLIGFEGACDIILDNLVHPDWRVRAVACRFAFLCPWERVGGALVERLKDESYHVRINAGRTILYFRDRAKKVFERLLSSEDRFAQDTARYFLQELEVRNA